MFRKILVAVDGSRHSGDALALAVDLAQRYGASLYLLHAFPHVSDLLGTPYHEDLLEARMMIGRQLLEAARMQAGEGISIETELVEGPPASAILRVAEEGHYDLIALGSRGHGQIPGLLLGSVSSAVAQRARCPVLIVH